MRIGPFEISEPVPELREPHALAMLRPWVDIGNVGSLVLASLERHFGSKELGKLARPGNFFDFTRYRPTIVVQEGQREITVPNSYINYAQPESGPGLLFLHLLEPHMFGEDYSDAILEVMKTFGVKRYFLIGSMYDAVPHTRPLLVTGTVGNQRGGPSRVQQSTYQGPTTITYLVSQRAPEAGVETSSVIVHLPQYVQLEEDFKGTARVLEALQDLYDLPSALIDNQKGRKQYQEISKAMTSNPRLAPVVKQLEASYDARAAEQPQEETPSELSPEVEKFLEGLDFENR